MRAHLSDGHLYSGDKVRKLQAKHYFLIDTGAGEKVFLNLYDAECYCMDHQLNPDEVIKSGDPETWLRAVKLAQVKAITLKEQGERLKKLMDEAEVAADGYLSLLRTTREDLEDVISKGEAGLGKKEILIKLKRIRQNINNNL